MTLALRIDPQNPDHHLWNNHGTWWLHLCLRDHPSLKARRVRQSLRTTCLLTARIRRDAILGGFITTPNVSGMGGSR